MDNLAITTGMLSSNSVTTNQLGAAAVTTAKIANDAITSVQILNGTIGVDKLGTGAVTADKILDGTIASADIAADTITAGDIAPGAVASSEILDASISTADIADAAITTAKVADAAVTTAKIASGVNLSAGTLAATGNATIGLVNGTATLKVNDKPVPVGEENLRIIRGSVNADGTIALGTGFSVASATPGFAAWQVNFSTPFSATPTVLVSDYNSQDGFHAVVADPANANSFRCYYTMYNNNPTRRGFSFIAIGPR